MLPVCHSLLQLSQQVFVELVQLRQVVQDLTEDPLIYHRLPILTGCLGNGIPKILERDAWVNSDKALHTHRHSWAGWKWHMTTNFTTTDQEHLINWPLLHPTRPHLCTYFMTHTHPPPPTHMELSQHFDFVQHANTHIHLEGSREVTRNPDVLDNLRSLTHKYIHCLALQTIKQSLYNN